MTITLNKFNFRHEFVKRLVITSLLFITLSLINSSWRFTRYGIDPWLYLGYMIHFPSHILNFPDTYYGARLAWLIPTGLTHKIFCPEIANALIDYTVFTTCILSLWTVLANFLDKYASLICTLIFASSPIFLISAGWDHYDPGALTGYLLALALTIQGPKYFKHMWHLSLLIGLIYGGMLHSQIFTIVIVPSLLVIHLGKDLQKPLSWDFWMKVIGVILGVIGTTVTLGFISLFLTNKFWFFIPSFNTAIYYLKLSNPWYIPLKEWIPDAYWLFAIAVSFLITICYLIKNKTRDFFYKPSLTTLFFIGNFLNILSYIVLQAIGNPVPNITITQYIFILWLLSAYPFSLPQKSKPLKK